MLRFFISTSFVTENEAIWYFGGLKEKNSHNSFQKSWEKLWKSRDYYAYMVL